MLRPDNMHTNPSAAYKSPSFNYPIMSFARPVKNMSCSDTASLQNPEMLITSHTPGMYHASE